MKDAGMLVKNIFQIGRNVLIPNRPECFREKSGRNVEFWYLLYWWVHFNKCIFRWECFWEISGQNAQTSTVSEKNRI